MLYTKEQRSEIGRLIYIGELTVNKAASQYGISFFTARCYLREYRILNNLPAKEAHPPSPQVQNTEETNSLNSIVEPVKKEKKRKGYEELVNLSKDELINEVIKARVEEARAKKGYTVKGGGQEKEFIPLKNVNTK